MQRTILGILAAGLIAAGLYLLQLGSKEGPVEMAAALLLRAGMVLGAVWLALPQLRQLGRRTSPWVLKVAGALLLLVVFGRRYVLVIGPLVALYVGIEVVGNWLRRNPRNRQVD